MQNSIFFSILSLIYCWIIAILFLSKEKIKSRENNIYLFLLLFTIIGLNLEIIISLKLGFNLFPQLDDIIVLVLNKLLIAYMISWLIILTYYVIFISVKKDKLLFSLKYITALLMILSLILSFILPIKITSGAGIAYSSGAVTKMAYVFCGFLEVVCLISFIIGLKKYKIALKKYYPILTFVIFGGIFMFIQYTIPELTLMLSVHSIVISIMYHTIENPDMKMVQELELAKSQAEKANNAKTDFLSNMSHEIRTPLNAIVGFSHSLEKEDLSESAREDVKYIISASDNLLDIVNGILDISKIEANKLEIVNKEYNTKELLDNLVALAKARLGEEKPIEFRYKFDESLPEYLYGDSTRLKQVIINLLTNSIKYTDEGFIEFKVDYIKLKNNIVRLIISVEDSGIGIKKENIDKLFNKFQRLDLEKNISIEGTGLGLAITKKLVNLMGGRIVVQSVYGKGSKFTVAVDQRIVAAPEAETFKMPEGEMVSEFPGKRILVVDDNKLNLKVAEKLLSEYKVTIECANSGDEAIEMVQNFEKYDIILMDDMMPHKTGSETLVELKQIPDFTVPVIALTANAIEGMKEKYLSIGFNDYLSKPIDKNELTRVLNTYLK